MNYIRSLSLFIHYSQFSQRALQEVERFHEHKNANLQESLANYVMLQLKLSKMVCVHVYTK